MAFGIVERENGVEVLESHVTFWDKETISSIYATYLFTRKKFTLYLEWFIHTLCYKIHFQRERARNVLFEYDNSWFVNMFKGL